MRSVRRMLSSGISSHSILLIISDTNASQSYESGLPPPRRASKQQSCSFFAFQSESDRGRSKMTWFGLKVLTRQIRNFDKTSEVGSARYSSRRDGALPDVRVHSRGAGDDRNESARG